MGTFRKGKSVGTERTRRALSERNENEDSAQRGEKAPAELNEVNKSVKTVKKVKKTVAKRTVKNANNPEIISEPADENNPEKTRIREKRGPSRLKRAPLSVKNTAEAQRIGKGSTDHIFETPRSSIDSKTDKVRIAGPAKKKVLKRTAKDSSNVTETGKTPENGSVQSNKEVVERPVSKKAGLIPTIDEVSSSDSSTSGEPEFKVPRCSPRQLAKTVKKVEADAGTKKILRKKKGARNVIEPLSQGTKKPMRTPRKRVSLSEQTENEAEHVFKMPGPSTASKTVRRIKSDEAKKRVNRTPKGTKDAVDSESDTKLPVYKKAGMTPLKRIPLITSTKEKLHEYDFEFDETEEEPKPKKKRKPIMKIQRMRTYAKKKKEPAKENPSIPLIIQQMLLSTPMKDASDKKRIVDKENIQPHRVLDIAENEKPSSSPCKEPTICETSPEQLQPSSEHNEPPPSPCPSFDDNDCPPSCPSSPVASGDHDNLQRSFHTVPLPTLHFGPITDSSTPNYVTSSTPRYSGCQSIRKSNLLSNMSMNTPIKYHCDVSDFSCNAPDEPREFILENCFGFDEWDVDDPNQIRNNPQPPDPRPKPVNLPKPPSMSAAEVIKLLEGSSVEEDPSMYESNDETFSERTSNEFTSTFVDQTESFVSNATSVATMSETVVESHADTPVQHGKALNARKVRKSYDRPLRPRRFPKNKSFEEEEKESDDEHSGEESDEEEEAKEIQKKTNKKPKKREHGMTKKELDEFEKWAAMFNAQCKEIEKYQLCVE